MKNKIESITQINIEKTILNFLLKSGENRNKILPKIKDEDFIIEKNKFIFKTIKILVLKNNNSLDLNIIANYLEQEGNLKKIGGLSYLTDILDIYAPSLIMDLYVEGLIKNSTKNKLEKELINWKNKTQKSSDINEIIFELRNSINSIDDFFRRNFEKFISLEETIKKFFNERENYNVDKKITGFKTGFQKLDLKLNGFQKGDLIILASRPSIGKTTLAVNMITPIVDLNNGKGDVLFFSLEMSSEQLAKKIIFSRTEFFNKNSKEDRKKLKNNFIELIAEKNIFIDNSSSIDIFEIGSKLREWRRTRKISLVVIDYLQLLNSTKDERYKNNRNLEISSWTRQLKQLAREIDIPILCISQLSRNVEKREDKHPLLSDLRDSGSIEQDADVVMFLYREIVYAKKSDENYWENLNLSHRAEINIVKHRNGPIGKIDLLFTPKKQTFLNYESED